MKVPCDEVQSQKNRVPWKTSRDRLQIPSARSSEHPWRTILQSDVPKKEKALGDRLRFPKHPETRRTRFQRLRLYKEKPLWKFSTHMLEQTRVNTHDQMIVNSAKEAADFSCARRQIKRHTSKSTAKCKVLIMFLKILK